MTLIKQLTLKDTINVLATYDFKHCYGLEFETVINSDAKIYPCFMLWNKPEFLIGDLTKQSFDEIWRSDRRREVLNRIYYDYDIRKCGMNSCRQGHISEALSLIKHPPIHRNFL